MGNDTADSTHTPNPADPPAPPTAPVAAIPRSELRRDLPAGIGAYGRWLRNPVSPEGVTARHRARFALNGPETARQLEQMQRDPVGRRVLADRPDLGAALGDMTTLAAMPEGSLGRTYHTFMDRPEVIPSALLASLLHSDGHLERLPWDEEMKFIVERRTHTHDLTHVLSGYGTSFPAEAINIGFSYGIEGAGGRALAETLTVLSFAVMWPTVGARRWRQLVVDAHQRGATAARRRPLPFVYIEELLRLPLDEARREIGIPPLASTPASRPRTWSRCWPTEPKRCGPPTTSPSRSGPNCRMLNRPEVTIAWSASHASCRARRIGNEPMV